MNILTASLSHPGTRASNQDVIGERLGSLAACFVTRDHSLVQRMKAAGHQTEGVSDNLLYLALGMSTEGDDATGMNRDLMQARARTLRRIITVRL